MACSKQRKNPMDQSAGKLEDICVQVEQLSDQHCLYERVQKLVSFYSDKFDGAKPAFIVKIPGRVNIIGEHVDYCGYPVLPMAIDQCMLLAVGHMVADVETSSQLLLRNMQYDKFSDFDLKSLCDDLAGGRADNWFRYFLCGVRGIYDMFPTTERQAIKMCIAVDGNVPPAAGLSSSSALVCAAVLATAHVHSLPLNRKKLAGIAARCERYVGTQGGGMDQAIAYLAKAGYAQYIEFQPELRASPLQLPGGVCFVVANSMVEMRKAATSDFNERVVECRLASFVLAKMAGLPNWRELKRFARLQAALQCNLDDMAIMVHNVFAVGDESVAGARMTRAQISQILEIEEADLASGLLTVDTAHMQTFKLYARSLHVIQESQRVQNFKAICNRMLPDSPNNAEDLNDLGNLMRESQDSLRRLYECSHPDLDRLIKIAESMGASARLTGAGWGGCIVALCESPQSSKALIDAIKTQYYAELPEHLLQRHKPNNFADLVFATTPAHGAQLFTL